jgi:hypothetical protein
MRAARSAGSGGCQPSRPRGKRSAVSGTTIQSCRFSSNTDRWGGPDPSKAPLAIPMPPGCFEVVSQKGVPQVGQKPWVSSFPLSAMRVYSVL